MTAASAETRVTALLRRVPNYEVKTTTSQHVYEHWARQLLRQAEIYRRARDPEQVFVALMRFSVLVMETIPSHPAYRPQAPYAALKERLPSIVRELEHLKQAINQRWEEARKKRQAPKAHTALPADVQPFGTVPATLPSLPWQEVGPHDGDAPAAPGKQAKEEEETELRARRASDAHAPSAPPAPAGFEIPDSGDLLSLVQSVPSGPPEPSAPASDPATAALDVGLGDWRAPSSATRDLPRDILERHAVMPPLPPGQERLDVRPHAAQQQQQQQQHPQQQLALPASRGEAAGGERAAYPDLPSAAPALPTYTYDPRSGQHQPAPAAAHQQPPARAQEPPVARNEFREAQAREREARAARKAQLAALAAQQAQAQAVPPAVQLQPQAVGVTGVDPNAAQAAPSCSCPAPPQDARERALAEWSARGGGDNGEMRGVHISLSLLDDFMHMARSNTRRGIETCGILAGELDPQRGVFTITALIVPKQEGHSDSVSATHEEEIFEAQEERSLFPLGWVHTHPTQTCFLSSIDVHTQSGYQTMLDEAIAIVMAPTDPSKKCGIFRLTTPGGLSLVQKCRQSGFHPHPPTSTGQPIYEHSGHVFVNPRVKHEVVDLRSK